MQDTIAIIFYSGIAGDNRVFTENVEAKLRRFPLETTMATM